MVQKAWVSPSLALTLVDHASRGPAFQGTPILDRGNGLFVRRVALVLGRQLPLQRTGPAAGPARGAGRAVVGPGLGQALSRCSAAAVRQRKGSDAAVQSVCGGARA